MKIRENTIKKIDDIKNIDEYEFARDAPVNLITHFKLVSVLCLITQGKINIDNYSQRQLSETFGINRRTLYRFLERITDIHKKYWEIFENDKIFCNINNIKEKFEYFIIQFYFKTLTTRTIRSNKFTNKYYKIAVEKNIVEYEKLNIKRKPKPRKTKVKGVYRKRNRQEILDDVDKPDFPVNMKRKKVNIIANSTSSELIKKLAKKNNCKIIQFRKDNKIGESVDIINYSRK